MPVNLTDDQGLTALHLSAIAGNVSAVRVLLEAGALPNRQTPDEKTTLDLALDHGHDDVAELLRKTGSLSGEELKNLEAIFDATKKR